MSTLELDTKRMSIFRLLLHTDNENILQEVENILENVELEQFTKENLVAAISQSQNDIANGKVRSMEYMRAKHQSCLFC